MKLALAGKGGVGKTTIAAALVKLFAEKGHRVFAVDADPDSNLGASLGLPSSILRRLTPIVEMKDLVEERTGKGAFLVLNPDVDDILDRYRVRVGDISLFRMGGVKAAGTQCYCRENAFLKALVSALVLKREDLVVLDFGAGIEHLTRGTARGVDLLLVVTEPTRVSADSAATMVRLGRDLGVGEVRVVGNKVRTERD
ncbi:MAG TPA: carbon monoxide dehydrogenase, partial [Clostridiales bacterium]|nr:carbon monoxide dehydrogenase [Clostridiales bacterium]